MFDRFPGLRLASVENGASWVPDMLHRLDDAANRNPGFFAEHPREQFGEHVWITPFWEDDVASLLADVRADRLLLGSDWPHAEGMRQPADFVTESLVGLPADDRADDRQAERARRCSDLDALTALRRLDDRALVQSRRLAVAFVESPMALAHSLRDLLGGVVEVVVAPVLDEPQFGEAGDHRSEGHGGDLGIDVEVGEPLRLESSDGASARSAKCFCRRMRASLTRLS